MRCARQTVVAVLPALLALGCTRVVDGATRPAPNLKPRPLTGEAVNEVLPDGVELSTVFGQSFESRTEFRPRYGSVDELHDVRATPADCAGASEMMPRNAYRDVGVDTVATHLWWNSTPYDLDPAVISVNVGVAALSTTADANTAFGDFTRRWQGCSGTTVTAAGSDYRRRISDVQAADSVVSAVVQVEGVTTVDHVHTLGVRANCLVEIDIALFGDAAGSRGNNAVDVAHQMMDKVSELT